MNPIPETFNTLQMQVDALAAGTNPVVYFPPGIDRLPVLPGNAQSTVIYGNGDGDGTYYFSPFHTTAENIHAAVRAGLHGKLLGFVQSKDEVALGYPGVLVVRDLFGCEIKAAAVDVNNLTAMAAQKSILAFQFPGKSITVETMHDVLRERVAAMVLM
jgi:hypothetical protein